MKSSILTLKPCVVILNLKIIVKFIFVNGCTKLNKTIDFIYFRLWSYFELLNTQNKPQQKMKRQIEIRDASTVATKFSHIYF